MISLDEALSLFAAYVAPLPIEDVAAADALWHVLAVEARSAVDLPPFPQSAMDGFAVLASDTTGAADASPVRLRLAGTSAAGRRDVVPVLRSGEAVTIYTGGHVPEGADAVVRQEDVRVEDGSLVVAAPVPVGSHVRMQAEELRVGDLLAGPGARVTPGLVGAMAVAGIARIAARPRPRVAVLTTGDEVVAAGGHLATGEVYDANGPLVAAWLRAEGCGEVTVRHVRDDPAGTESELRAALSGADLVLTTGGVSVGARDYVLPAARAAGVRDVFWRVRQKPGKPLYFGVRDGVPLVGLPGNPGAVFACLTVHVRRVLDLLQSASPPGPTFVSGRLGFEVTADRERDVLLRCVASVGENAEVHLGPLPHQASHMIGNLAHCTGLARIAAGSGELPVGAVVPWTPCRALPDALAPTPA